MNRPLPSRTALSACPHDCPSTCALEVEVVDPRTIGRVYGARENDYTAGVICAKVARYAERIHNPNRLVYPLRRKGRKADALSGAADWRDTSAWERIGWDDALDIVAEAFVAAEARHGSEALWAYYYGGTMGLVEHRGIQPMRPAKRYYGEFETLCTRTAWAGRHRRPR